MRTRANSAPNSIPPALVLGSVLRIVPYATFRLLGYVEVFKTTLEAAYIMINISIQRHDNIICMNNMRYF